MDYVVDLDSFHGPLDLLLYLIDENQIDIYDIPIAKITDQYMEYLDLTGDFDLEKLGDFLVMASYLLTLKTQIMLPQKQEDEIADEGDDMDPRAELVQRLLYYKKYKMAAEKLEAIKNGEIRRTFYRDQSTSIIAAQELSASIHTLAEIMMNLRRKNQGSQGLFNIPREDIDVGEKMEQILATLQRNRRGIKFQDFFRGITNKRELSALFLALLELMRLQKVKAVQQNDFGMIKIKIFGAGDINVNEK